MKYVLVTGACGGMGKAVVQALLKNGYFVFGLDKQASEVKNNYFPLKADIADEESLAEAFWRVSAVAEGLDAILHFSGTYALDSLVEMKEKDLQKLFDVNLFGVYRVNKTFLPLLKSGSRLVIVSSELAPLDPLPFTGAYAVVKSALEKYAYSLRMELQLLGIDVAVLRPGAVRTDMLDVSTQALEKFCANTTIYTCNAKRFKKIVNKVEARSVSPEKVAKKALKILEAKRPKYVYCINRNPLLLLLGGLPKRMQTALIRKILK